MAEDDPTTWVRKSWPEDGAGNPISCDDDGCSFGVYELDKTIVGGCTQTSECFACVQCGHAQPPIPALLPDSGAPESYQHASASFMATAPESTLPNFRLFHRPEVVHIDRAIGRFGIENTVE